MSQILIGKVSIVPCGEFQLGTKYDRLSVVSYNGSSYIAKTDNQNVPISNAEVWYLLAQQGNGIISMELISTVGLVSTYRITFSDGTYFDLEIKNGGTKTSDLQNDGEDGENPFITKEVNNLTNYELKADTATTLEVSFNSETYVITLVLKNSSGTALATQTVTLPLGDMFVSANYAEGTLTFTNKSGETSVITFGDLVPTSRTIAGIGLNDNISIEDLIDALSVYTKGQVDDIITPLTNKVSDLDLLTTNLQTEEVLGQNLKMTNALNAVANKSTIYGKTEQDFYNGYNLFNIDSILVGEINEDGDLVIPGENTTFYTTTFELNTVYSMSANIKGSGSTQLVFSYTDGTSDSVGLINDSEEFANVFVSSDKTKSVSGVNVTYTSSGSLIIQDGKILLAKGITRLPYEPYTGGLVSPSILYPQTIKNVTGDTSILVRGKNIFDKNSCELVNKKMLDENGDVITSASSSYTESYVFVMPNTTYTIQGTQAATGANVRIYYYTFDKEWIYRSGTFDRDSFSFTTPNDCYYIRLQLRDTSHVDTNIIQIEYGSVATLYVPYVGASIMFPLSDGQSMYQGDYLSDDGIHHVRKQKVFNGTENFVSYTSGNTTNYYCYRINIADSKRSPSQVELDTEKCNYFIQKSWYSVYSSKIDELSFSTSVDSTYRYFKTTQSTAESFKSWLASQYENNSPMILEYELAIEEIEPYSLAQQDAWNNVKNIQLYADFTQLYVYNENIIPDIYIEYYKKTLQPEIDDIKHQYNLLKSNFNQKETDVLDNISVTDCLSSTIMYLTPVGVTQQIVTTGKNIFNKNANVSYRGNARETITDYGVRVTDKGTSSGNHYVNFSILSNLENYAGSRIRFTAIWYNSASNLGRLILRVSGEAVTQGGASGTVYSYVVPDDLPENTSLSLSLYSNYNGTVENGDYVDYYDIIVTIDNEDMTYEPYTGGKPSPSMEYPQEIYNVEGDISINVSGKNYFNIKDTYEKGTSVYTYNYYLKPNTQYTISSNCPQSNPANIYVNSSSTSSSTSAYIGHPITVTSDSNGHFYISVRFATTYAQSGEPVKLYDGLLSGLYWLQIEEGNQATRYEPYKNETVIFPLSPNQKLFNTDYLALDGIHHKAAQKVFDGSGGVNAVTETRFVFVVSNSRAWTKVWCNFFSSDSEVTPRLVGSNSAAQLWLWDTTGIFEGSAENVKAFLSEKNREGTPVVAQYYLNAESVEPYTKEQQIAWDKITKLEACRDLTKVVVSATGVQPKVKMTYLVDDRVEINNRLDELEQAIAALGNNV